MEGGQKDDLQRRANVQKKIFHMATLVATKEITLTHTYFQPQMTTGNHQILILKL